MYQIGTAFLTDGFTMKGKPSREKVTLVAIKNDKPVVLSRGINILTEWACLTPQVSPTEADLAGGAK